MPPTPQAFTDDEALACKDRRTRIRFVSHLMARHVYNITTTADRLMDLWEMTPDSYRHIREGAREIYYASLDCEDAKLRAEVLRTLAHVRFEAMKAYEAMMAEDKPREAQKFLETAKGAASGLAALLPKQAGDGETEVRLVVEVGSTERPKVE